ncbi:ATP-binding protein [Elasticomyces elasticus]|nr:ATP-binding protein [Elasticomyces elasticus]
MPTPAARQTYLAISSIIRRQNLPLTRTRCLHTTRHPREDGSYHPKDFTTQGHGFTNNYTSRPPITGPISSSPSPPRITPSTLKQHLDNFVVGQDRAKRVLATAVYNHYQRITELERREAEEEELYAQEERRRMGELRRHPVEGMEDRDVKPGIRVPSLTREFNGEDEFPGQQATINMPPPNNPSQAAAEQFWRPPHQRQTPPPPQSRPQQQQTGPGSAPLIDTTPLTIEKSNILLLGPSGVGKTLMAKTLARVLEVPFSMSDCTPFTQAGYIGEDAEVCVQRLLAAANYDVSRAERGIICLDEIDKIATARVSHGKDVSGEGVQQALLKIIEGTTVQVQVKQERSSSSGGSGGGRQGGAYGSAGGNGGGGAGGKGEVYNVRTDNILFICAGAFNGLHKMVLDRISKGSIGFGAPIRSSTTDSSNNNNNIHETVLDEEEGGELFEKYLPYYRSEPSSQNNNRQNASAKPKRKFNTLDLVEPQDLQKFGLIPEFVGRLPLSCALSSLDVESLVKVLTEPRNSLLQQYKQLFALSSVELRITSPALRVMAKTASSMGTGARGLKTVLERLLGDAMFETPGSSVKYVLVTEDVAERLRGVWYFGRKEGQEFREIWGREEEAWEMERQRRESGDGGEGGEGEWERRARVNSVGGAARTFEEYREKAAAGGFV